MHYISEPGMIYDTICYSTIYFNRQTISAGLKLKNEDDLFFFYERFRMGKRKVDPPQKLYPFFYYDGKILSPIAVYFFKTFDFLTDNFKSFIEKLNLSEFKKLCFSHYLAQYENEVDIEFILSGDVDSILKAVALMSVHNENLIYFVDFFRHFETLVCELVDYLTDLYGKMKSFHSKYVPTVFNEIYEEYLKNEEILKKMYQIDNQYAFKDDAFSILMMQHFAILENIVLNRKILFFFGANSIKSISKWLGDYSRISVVSFGKAFGNEVKYDIIQELRKGEKTVSQLSKKLFISRSTVDRYLLSLCDELVVKVVKKAGTEIYYSLNPYYVIAAKEEINRYLDGIWRDHENS
jgi:DNA-binding transcriptional ArsR family regulator